MLKVKKRPKFFINFELLRDQNEKETHGKFESLFCRETFSIPKHSEISFFPFAQSFKCQRGLIGCCQILAFNSN
jgi:hypothetical protein